MNEVSHSITEINRNDTGTFYKVTVQVPMSLGYVDHISFDVYKNGYDKKFDLKHTINKNGYSYFEDVIFLEKSNLYHYYFKFKINNAIYFKRDDSFKISSLYETPILAMNLIFAINYLHSILIKPYMANKSDNNYILLNDNQSSYVLSATKEDK